MIRSLLELLVLLSSGMQIIPLPGIPVSICQVDNGFAAACCNPPSICIFHTDGSVEFTGFAVLEPRDVCLWNGELAAADYTGRQIVTERGIIPVPGNPHGICEVLWNASSASVLAVALFDSGRVILLNKDGTVTPLVDMPGVKSLSACDADGDGDMDLFASGCGSGAALIENTDSVPGFHYAGNIQAGVKRCCAVDMNADGLMDVAGIACAEGGAGWWENPGDNSNNWVYSEIDGSIQGPKDISSTGDRITVASLFSKPLISWYSDCPLPGGFLCCYISEDGSAVLGHRLRLAVVVPAEDGDRL